MDQPFIFAYISHNETFSIFETKWIPGTAKFAAIGGTADKTGCIKVFELNGDRCDLLHVIDKKNSLRCAAFGLSRSRQSYLSTGDFNGSLQIIDVVGFDAGAVYNVPNAHRGVINAIDTVGSETNHGASEIVTGGQDGCVKVWDPRQPNDPVVKIEPHEQDVRRRARDCWAVAFGGSHNNAERCVCAGFDNGDVKMFDLRTVRTRWETNVRNGVCDIETQNKYDEMSELAVSTAHGGLNIFTNISEDFSQMPTIAMKDADVLPSDHRKHAIWRIKHLPQNTDIFATCGGSGNLRLWQKPEMGQSNDSRRSNELKLITELPISNEGVNCFDWCADHSGLAVCGSFDRKLKVVATANLPV